MHEKERRNQVMITTFFNNHLGTVVLIVLAAAFASSVCAFLAFPSWRKKARRAMRRGMADSVSMNPFCYVPIAMVTALILACLVLAGSDEADWVVEATETVSLSPDAQVLPHTDDGIELVSVIDEGKVYVFSAEDVDYVKRESKKPQQMVIEHVNAFLRPKRDRAAIR